MVLNLGCVQVNPDCLSADIHMTPLLAAVLNNHDAVARFLLSRGADANQPIVQLGLTPLMIASLYSKPNLVQTLIDSGADTNAVSNRGKTVLDLLSRRPRPEIRALIEPRISKKLSSKSKFL